MQGQAQRFVEDCPTVDIGLLQRRGLFVHDGYGKLALDLGGVVVEFFYVAGRSSFSYALPDWSCPTTIELETAHMKFGGRRYFVCPVTRTRATKLYFLDALMASRKGHNLKHLSQSGNQDEVKRGHTLRLAERLKGSAGKGSLRGAKRKAVVSQILDEGDARWLDAETQRIIRSVEGASVSAEPTWMRPASARMRASTMVAIRRGRSAKALWTEERILTEHALRIRRAEIGLVKDNERRRRARPNDITVCARLDTRSLANAELLREGSLSAVELRWPQELMGNLEQLVIITDLRPEFWNYALLSARCRGMEEDHIQVRQLRKMGAGRWAFRCPITEKLSTTLYLHDDLFASRAGWEDTSGLFELKTEPIDWSTVVSRNPAVDVGRPS